MTVTDIYSSIVHRDIDAQGPNLGFNFGEAVRFDVPSTEHWHLYRTHLAVDPSGYARMSGDVTPQLYYGPGTLGVAASIVTGFTPGVTGQFTSDVRQHRYVRHTDVVDLSESRRANVDSSAHIYFPPSSTFYLFIEPSIAYYLPVWVWSAAVLVTSVPLTTWG